MVVSHLEILVEEPSIEAALRLLIPRVLAGVTYQIYPYQCKDDLLTRLPNRLKGYAAWLPIDSRIIVVVDRDDDDCRELKRYLDEIARTSGLQTRAGTEAYQVVNRIAVEELEAWFFGDWSAVKAAYPKVPNTVPNRAGYRDPGAIQGGTWEAFERILQRAGYFATGLRKIEAARAVAAHRQPDSNRSHSFGVFYQLLRELNGEQS